LGHENEMHDYLQTDEDAHSATLIITIFESKETHSYRAWFVDGIAEFLNVLLRLSKV